MELIMDGESIDRRQNRESYIRLIADDPITKVNDSENHLGIDHTRIDELAQAATNISKKGELVLYEEARVWRLRQILAIIGTPNKS
jgi:hypothetical protein